MQIDGSSSYNLSSVAQHSLQHKPRSTTPAKADEASSSGHQTVDPAVTEKVDALGRIQNALRAALSMNEYIEKNALFAPIA